MHTILAAALAATLVTPASPTSTPQAAPDRAADLPLVWDGDAADPAEIAEALGDAVAEVATHWAIVAQSHDAEVELSEDGRVLLYTHSTGSKRKKELKLVAETLELVDELLPQRPDTSAEDDREAYMETPTDSETLVLLQVEDEEEYADVLAEVAELEPYLAGWAESAKDLAGFTLTRPLAACWIETLDDMEEWDIRNELVHRLTHVAVARRFGELPYWLQMGLNWHVEEELLGGIYCFPNRVGFVWATEHTSWDKDLRSEFKGSRYPFFENLADWRRGTYLGRQARQAFGFARFLAEHHTEELPQVLADLFHLRAVEGVTVQADGSWQLIPGWEPSYRAQTEVFERVLGEGILDEVVEYFVDGSRYKKPRRRS